MIELVEFLRARLDEDEALAREAPPGPWHIGNAVDPTQPCHVHTFPGVRMVADGLNWLVAEHIARQNPARVLSEITAKRRVLRDLEDARLTLAAAETGTSVHDLMTGAVNSLERVVRLLAQSYASHPDYREEWKP